MTASKVLLTALLAFSATVGFAVTPAEGAHQLAVADNATARASLYSTLIGTDFTAADPLMAEVTKLCFGPLSQLDDAVCDPVEGSTILQEILAYLKANGASDELLASLYDKYLSYLTVEPAAGPEGTNPDFGGEDGNDETLENPNQLSPNQP